MIVLKNTKDYLVQLEKISKSEYKMNKKLLETRLNDMISNDKIESTFSIEKVLKCEIINVLKNYFILPSDSVDLEISHANGRYLINITAVSSSVRQVKFVN